MKYLGISEGFHDAAVALVNDKREIEFASHAERKTRIKNCRMNPPEYKRLRHDKVIFHEDVEFKNERRAKYGMNPLPVPEYDTYLKHHESHMAAAKYTAPWDTSKDTVCVVIDAIGEWDCTTIWKDDEVVYREMYPESIGLFYSAITKRIGLKPNEDEYITMGMAAFGSPEVDMAWCFSKHCNLHRGFGLDDFKGYHPYDIAASAQLHLEWKLNDIMEKASSFGKNLCYGGGVALNCVANTNVVAPHFEKVWILPSPGDAGSSIGAVAGHLKEKINWVDPYLGHNIERWINPKIVVTNLLKDKVVGVANGKAEFGPRALGNRSLLGDVRYNIKNTVNGIKRRQKFRPFAPAILEEFALEYFEGHMNEYMQFTAEALHDYDSVTHVDGSARVQIVRKDCQSALRPILEEYYERTKVPMLLNTSLNIKGQPIVDTWEQAQDFSEKYKVGVY